MADMVRIGPPSYGSRYKAPEMRIGRSQFSLAHGHKTTFDAGYLIPYLVMEVLPGDTFTSELMAFVRIFSPLTAPIMDNIEVAIDYFYVPNRLVWNNWEAFLGAHDDAGAQDVDYTIPIVDGGTTFDLTADGRLNGIYMGIPNGLQSGAVEISCLPFRGLMLIYNEWYRDQNLIDSIVINKGDGPDAMAAFPLLKSAKKHDYFTSALPYLQKGDPVSVSLGTTANIGIAGPAGTEAAVLSPDASFAQSKLLRDAVNDFVELSGSLGSTANLLYADLSTATGVSINALREAAAVQRLLERDARGGTRYTEQMRAHFGVDVPDYRVQRPEYLGGGQSYVNVSPVANTSATATEDQGELAGVGTGTLRARWAKSFVEHGYIFGILRARGELTYQQGLERHWSRSTKLDFMWPELVNLGEQPIYNKELFVSNLAATDDGVFGYQERYADYRYKKSLVTGKFASDATGSLDYWHLSEDFASLPGLNQTFIEDQTPMSRVTAVPAEPDFLIDGRHDIRAARALPVRPTPSLAPARF